MQKYFISKDPEKLTKDFTLELLGTDLFNYAKDGLLNENYDICTIRNQGERSIDLATNSRPTAMLLIDIKYMPQGQ